MDLSYLTFASSEDLSIKLESPLHSIKRGYDVSSCCDYLIDYQNSQQTKPTNQDESSKIEHWWKRKWQVSLDYYLSSPSEQIRRQQTEPAFADSQQYTDFTFSDETENDQLSPIQALLYRKTYRKFQEAPISSRLLSTLLRELKEGIFEDIWKYYIVIFNIEGIAPGIYRYCSTKHGLYLIRQGLFRNEVVKLLCGMAASFTASFLMIFTIDLEEAMKKFPYNRALREIYIDSGRLSQKILLKGMQHFVGGLPSPAMKDSQMCSFLGIDPNKSIPIYSVTMGIVPEKSLSPEVAT
jgi:SagB-type dehydrogenase family enzyme